MGGFSKAAKASEALFDFLDDLHTSGDTNERLQAECFPAARFNLLRM